MGIQGLLPLLKPIQRQRHLSEFAGQTIAVDAYVWLHRGAYACAADLVLGRPTRRYVDFCMARVRLLRHHRIEPYLVFDGGPLPAKLGTEKERKKRREENARRAKELWSQGRRSQAMEHFTKCVDVTPQMAYQVIKALKAENVNYVVAPYEADAQLVYLERAGLVDGILTEDSDLLVFGCRNVHVKLDTASATVVSISRVDFGSPALAKDSFSLIGWSEAQFRWMAMLSGCDYLPSIAGVGLKTAYHLLRKYKAVEKAVKMIQLEGKKTVPKDYLTSFRLAEKVFLHQRVYDPCRKKLVYLTSPPADVCLSEDVEMYIGRDMDPVLASRIAEGEVCPITFDEMKDINPSFAPKLIKPNPLQQRDMNKVRRPEAKASSKKGNLLSFLTPIPKDGQLSPARMQSPTRSAKMQRRMVVGNASGKRTLVDVIDCDIETKRKRVAQSSLARRSQETTSTSRFFSSSESAYGGRIDDTPDKENIYQPPGAQCEEPDDPVTQEDGYLSPSPSLSRAGTPDVSSPILSRSKNAAEDVCLSASPYVFAQKDAERILVRASSEPVMNPDEDLLPGPDLAVTLGTEDDSEDRQSDATSEIYCWDEDFAQGTENGTAPASQESPERQDPNDFSGARRSVSFDDPTHELQLLEIDAEDVRCREREAIEARLAQKWRLSYSLGAPRVRRTTEKKTTITTKDEALEASAKTETLRSRTPYSGRKPRRPSASSSADTVKKAIFVDADEVSADIAYNAKARLQTFRFSA